MKKSSLLWQIQHPDIQQPCYVFGTMHVRDQRAFAHIETLQQYVAQCQAFAAEFDLSDGNAVAFTDALLLPDGQRLEDLVSPTIYKKLAKIFERETGLQLAHFNRHKPLAVINILQESQFSEDTPHSLDATLYQFAQTQSKKILGIESFESQLETLRSLPFDTQIASLKEIASNFKKMRQQIQKTSQAYLDADLGKMLKLVKKNTGGMRKVLLYNRNEVMAARILEIGKTYSLFAAIGAGHLAGGRGVLRLLKQQGAKVQPLML